MHHFERACTNDAAPDRRHALYAHLAGLGIGALIILGTTALACALIRAL
ncbi:hypothetical protein [Paraburkholderia sp.]|nr:hypothetical protein [Paraburkholderia sp.]MDE1180849.1 hypothetical protein [Paraburkholderia sp.]